MKKIINKLKEIVTVDFVFGLGLGVYVRKLPTYDNNRIDIYITLPGLIININL
jgi:hypothetical protein